MCQKPSKYKNRAKTVRPKVRKYGSVCQKLRNSVNA